LQELERRSGHWFLALRSITGDDPVRGEDSGNFERMRESWLIWGRERGLI
jgi:hypothetical protein